MNTNSPYSRAFVVQFDPQCDPRSGSVAGRMEHIESGQATHFHSVAELLDFVARVLNKERQTSDQQIPD